MKVGIIQLQQVTDYIIDTDITIVIGNDFRSGWDKRNKLYFVSLDESSITYEYDNGFEDDDGDWIEEWENEELPSYEFGVLELESGDLTVDSQYIPISGTKTNREGKITYPIIKLEFED